MTLAQGDGCGDESIYTTGPTGPRRRRLGSAMRSLRAHSRLARLCRSVGPPRCHHQMWCTSQQSGGRSHPGPRQLPSRAITARRWGGVQPRVVRPTSRTYEEAVMTIRERAESHTRRDVASGDSTVPDPVIPELCGPRRTRPPRPSARSSCSAITTTEMCGRTPPLVIVPAVSPWRPPPPGHRPRASPWNDTARAVCPCHRGS